MATASTAAAGVVLKDTLGPKGDDMGAPQTVKLTTMFGMNNGCLASMLGDPNRGGGIPLKGNCGEGFEP